MANKKLHPSVVKFKEFVKNNPKVIQEVRQGKSTWQELYEEWYLLGEDDARFGSIGKENNVEKVSEPEKKSDWMSTITGMVKNMDPNQVQHHINNLSQAIGAIQGILSQFQGSNSSNPTRGVEGPKHPFSFRKD